MREFQQHIFLSEEYETARSFTEDPTSEFPLFDMAADLVEGDSLRGKMFCCYGFFVVVVVFTADYTTQGPSDIQGRGLLNGVVETRYSLTREAEVAFSRNSDQQI